MEKQKKPLSEKEFEYIILFCRRDQVWLVARKTKRTPHIYVTIAECFTEESATILWKELND